MSIIQQALKKAQDNTISKAPQRVPQPPGPAEVRHEPRKTPGTVRAKTFTRAAAVAVTVFLAVAIALVAFSLKPFFSAPAVKRAGLPAPEAPAQEVRYRPLAPAEARDPDADKAQAAELAARAPKLVLNGIMYLDEGPRAIVNNAMVGLGDYVSGAKVARITRKNVVLVYNDVEITLNLK